VSLDLSEIFLSVWEKRKKKKGEEEVKEGKGRYEEEKEETGHKNPLAIAASCSVSFPRFCTIV